MAEARIKTTIEFMPEDYERLRSYADKQDVGLASAIMGLLAAKRPREAFVPPSVEDVTGHCKDKGYTFDAEAFVAYYATRGWRVNGRLMSSWKSACVTWQKHDAHARTTPLTEPTDEVRAQADRDAAEQAAVMAELAETDRLRKERGV